MKHQLSLKNLPPDFHSFRGKYGVFCYRDQKVCGPVLSDWLKSYYFGLNHPMKMRVWSWVMSAWGEPRIVVPYYEKAWLALNIHDLLQRIILRDGVYEPEVWSGLAKFAVKDEVLWDIGAHIGTVSIKAALNPAIKEVHCFEPNPKTFQMLSLNLSLNQLNIRPHPFALSDKEEMIPIFEGTFQNSGIASFLSRPVRGANTHNVQTRTVDAMIYEHGLPAPTLMKIDVEGWEEKVLRGARRLLSSTPPKAIVFEDPNPELLSFLQSLKYRMQEIPALNGTETTRNVLASL